MFIDEKIAQLEKFKKESEEESKKAVLETEEEKVEEKAELDLEYVIKKMDEGLLEIEKRKFKFTRKPCLGNKIQMPIIEDYFETISDTDKELVLKQDGEGITLLLNTIPSATINVTNFKKGMEQNFSKMELYIEWVEEGSVEREGNKIQYYTFLTPTGIGSIYNFIFFHKLQDCVVIGNFNCLQKDMKIWEKIFKGILNLASLK